MNIQRKRITEIFSDYTSNYNVQDPKIKLKIDHTYRVAAISEQIARSQNLPEPEVDLAWLIGMLHDIGRFEQLRRFGTFSDADSIDHAKFGVRLLFEEGLLQRFLSDESAAEYLEQKAVGAPLLEAADIEVDIIRTAIWNHNEYRIPEGLEPRAEQFCHIIRDADKIDILKVNYEVPMEDIYNVTSEELFQAEVTPEVMEAFFERHAVLRKLKKTPIDHLVGHSALVFELVYPISLEIVREQGYLQKILAFESKNPKTNRQFEQLRNCMREYLEQFPKKES